MPSTRLLAPFLVVALVATFDVAGAAAQENPCFLASPNAILAKVGVPIAFSLDDNGSQVSGTVDWGDGTPASPTAPGKDAEHAYKKAGTYAVTATVSGSVINTDGGQSPCSSTTAPLGTVEVRAKLRAKIDYRSGKDNITVDGTGSTPAGDITSYSWTFDDGRTASGPTVHRKMAKGRHIVSLEVRNGFGDRALADRTVFVGLKPPAKKRGSDGGSGGGSESGGRSSRRNGSSGGNGGSGGSGSSGGNGGSGGSGSSGPGGPEEGSGEQPRGGGGGGGAAKAARKRFCTAAADFAEIATPLLRRGVPLQVIDPVFVQRYEADRAAMLKDAPARLKATVDAAFAATDLLLGGTMPSSKVLLASSKAQLELADYCTG